MPIYEYHCEACQQDFECLVLGSDIPVCPKCKGENVNRLMSICGFVSKADGGQSVTRSAGSSGCSGCAATSCGSCGH